MRSHAPVAHRTAVLFGAGDDAEDVVQESFVKAFRALDRFEGDGTFRPWLLAIVVNETRNLHRSARRRATLALRATLLPAESEAPDPAAIAAEHERRTTLLAAVRRLPEKDRAVVTCRYLLELSEAETAVVVGCPAGTVKSRLSRALRRLHAELGARPDDRTEVNRG